MSYFFGKLRAMRSSSKLILCAGVSLALAGCGASNAVTTGSLFGGNPTSSAPSQVQAPKTATPSDRAVYVAANVTRAQRCGFFFDAEQVKASFLASEQAAGTPPDVMQKITRDYDMTRAQLRPVIASDEAYCTEGRNREVKAALTRQLAGDFNPPQRRQDVNIGMFDHQKRNTELDGEAVFERSRRNNSQTVGGN